MSLEPNQLPMQAYRHGAASCGNSATRPPRLRSWPTLFHRLRRLRPGASATLAATLLFVGFDSLRAATSSEHLSVVPKWGRFETSFTSGPNYTNPPVEAVLSVQFTSPLGETIPVYGFWDGGRTWRVRFSPNQPGRWTYVTSCSDTANRGLDHQAGAFLCTAAEGQDRFELHGPVRLARDHRHFEHADGTTFLWVADTAWDGPRRSEPKDWDAYARVRSNQKFSAVQWAVSPATDFGPGQPRPFAAADSAVINPDFFKDLDGKVAVLNRNGLLSVIAPGWPPGTSTRTVLGQADLTAWLRYVVARFGADNVAWLLTCNNTEQSTCESWRNAGRAVFGAIPHPPVIVFAGPADTALLSFRYEAWVDAVGFGQGAASGDPSCFHIPDRQFYSDPTESGPAFLNVWPPPENVVNPVTGQRITADDVRRVFWSSFLSAPCSGVTYCADAVATWNTTPGRKIEGVPGNELPLWQKSLFLPGAIQMATAVSILESVDFLRLVPARLHSGTNSFVSAACSEAHDLGLVYVPEDHALSLPVSLMPGWPSVTWINPRTAEKIPAVGAVEAGNCSFAMPGAGDWLLLMKMSK